LDQESLARLGYSRRTVKASSQGAHVAPRRLDGVERLVGENLLENFTHAGQVQCLSAGLVPQGRQRRRNALRLTATITKLSLKPKGVAFRGRAA
jgi:hypothetical protein